MGSGLLESCSVGPPLLVSGCRQFGDKGGRRGEPSCGCGRDLGRRISGVASDPNSRDVGGAVGVRLDTRGEDVAVDVDFGGVGAKRSEEVGAGMEDG